MKIGYSKTYPISISGQWEKIWLEDEVSGTEEDVRNKLYSLKRQVESFHYESNAAEKKKQAEAAETPTGNRIQEIIQDIEKCIEVEGKTGLKSYHLLSLTSPEIKTAYEKRLKELLHG